MESAAASQRPWSDRDLSMALLPDQLNKLRLLCNTCKAVEPFSSRHAYCARADHPSTSNAN